jgi:hypothetical protein
MWRACVFVRAGRGKLRPYNAGAAMCFADCGGVK